MGRERTPGAGEGTSKSKVQTTGGLGDGIMGSGNSSPGVEEWTRVAKDGTPGHGIGPTWQEMDPMGQRTLPQDPGDRCRSRLCSACFARLGCDGGQPDNTTSDIGAKTLRSKYGGDLAWFMTDPCEGRACALSGGKSTLYHPARPGVLTDTALFLGSCPTRVGAGREWRAE